MNGHGGRRAGAGRPRKWAQISIAEGETAIALVREAGTPSPCRLIATENPVHAIGHLQGGNPRELVLAAALACSAALAPQLLAAFAESLAGTRNRGEWFNVTVEVAIFELGRRARAMEITLRLIAPGLLDERGAAEAAALAALLDAGSGRHG